jgi:hypothetical protein
MISDKFFQDPALTSRANAAKICVQRLLLSYVHYLTRLIPLTLAIPFIPGAVTGRHETAMDLLQESTLPIDVARRTARSDKVISGVKQPFSEEYRVHTTDEAGLSDIFTDLFHPSHKAHSCWRYLALVSKRRWFRRTQLSPTDSIRQPGAEHRAAGKRANCFHCPTQSSYPNSTNFHDLTSTTERYEVAAPSARRTCDKYCDKVSH